MPLSKPVRREKSVSRNQSFSAGKLKVGIVTRSLNRGGAEVLLRETFENTTFRDAVESCDLIILDKHNVALLEDLKGINCYLFNFFSYSFFNFVSEFYRLYKLIRSKKYKLLHAHLTNAGVLMRIFKFFMPRVKLVYTEHAMPDYYSRGPYYLNGLTYFNTNYTIFVSQGVKDNVDKHRGFGFYRYKKASVIANGVNTVKFNCPDRNALSANGYLTIGTLASLRKVKRLDQWLEVAELCKENYPQLPVKFIIAGDGPDYETVQRMISEKNLSASVELPGRIIDTVSVYSRIDIFLMTSEYEGLPVALLEAMSCGCIPITSNVGGIRSLEFTGFGYKYDVFNPADLVNVIVRYVHNKPRVYEEQAKARMFVMQNYTLEKQVASLIDVYKSL